MSKRFIMLGAAIAAASKFSGGGTSGIIQSTTFTLANNITSGTATFTSTTAAGNAVVIVGYGVINTGAAAGVLTVSDDKASTGWQIDSYVTPSSSSNFFTFIASNLNVTAGAKVITIASTVQFYSIQGGMLELHGVTTRRTPVTHSSNGSNESNAGGPVTIAYGSANPGPKALCLHGLVVDQLSSNVGMNVSASSGTFVNLITNNNSGSGAGPGLCGYILDSTTSTDSVTDAWGATFNVIAQALLTFNLA